MSLIVRVEQVAAVIDTIMSTSIRQKITLFTLVPAIVFYCLVTAVYLYFTFRTESVEISKGHLEQSLRYANIIDGHLKGVHMAGQSLALLLEGAVVPEQDDLPIQAERLLGDALLVTGVGLMYPDRPDLNRYWHKSAGHFYKAPRVFSAVPLPGALLHRYFSGELTKPDWHINDDASNPAIFPSTYLVPVVLHDKTRMLLRIDIDGSLLISPLTLTWSDPDTRLIILDKEGTTVYANGISLPYYRRLQPFISHGPCEGYSRINVTRENSGELVDFISRSIKTHLKGDPCAVFGEALQRVTVQKQSVNFRVGIRGKSMWVTATPIQSTGWYLGIRILEMRIIQPVVRQALISAGLIALALILTLICLWTVSGLITRPLNRLKCQMNEFATPYGTGPDDTGCDEAVSLYHSFNCLLQRLRDREKSLHLARANNISHLVQQLRGRYFYFNLDVTGTITHVSPSIKAILGYSVEEFSGFLQGFLSSSSLNKEVADKFSALASGQWEEAFEVEMRHQDGSVRRIELFCTIHEESIDVGGESQSQMDSQLPVVIEGMANDITIRINDTEKFKQLIASAPDATVICNEDGIISLVNRKVSELFGFKARDLVNMPLALLVAQDRRHDEPLLSPLDHARPESHCLEDYLTEGVNRLGYRFPMEVSSNVLDTAEGLQISIILRDITERKIIESELVEAKVSAEQASQAKSMFLSNISHELRTPLNGVLGYAQLLLSDDQVPEPYRDNLAALKDCGLHLMTLINDILDMTKIESSGVVLDPQPFILGSMLNTVLANVKETARNKGLELKADLDPAISLEIVGDSVKLRQILINLMGNAVKFTDNGSVLLEVRKDHHQLCFAVVDTGEGIRGSDLQYLFKPFGQLKSGRKQGGTGLGLAISCRLVKAMGGELVVSSELHVGSNFNFTVPYMPAVGSECAPASPGEVLAYDESNYHGHRILVVDDNENNRDMLSSALRTAKFIVDEAVDGAEAVKLCQNQHYNLVLMDLKMPVMDGIKATQTIHAQPDTRDLNIIAVSASVSDSTRSNISKVGACDFISKPVRFSELFSKVYRWMGEAPAADRHNIESDEEGRDVVLGTDTIKLLVSAINEHLDVGDVGALSELAAQWFVDGHLGQYPKRLIHCCGALDIAGIEKIRTELIMKLPPHQLVHERENGSSEKI